MKHAQNLYCGDRLTERDWNDWQTMYSFLYYYYFFALFSHILPHFILHHSFANFAWRSISCSFVVFFYLFFIRTSHTACTPFFSVLMLLVLCYSFVRSLISRKPTKCYQLISWFFFFRDCSGWQWKNVRVLVLLYLSLCIPLVGIENLASVNETFASWILCINFTN